MYIYKVLYKIHTQLSNCLESIFLIVATGCTNPASLTSNSDSTHKIGPVAGFRSPHSDIQNPNCKTSKFGERLAKTTPSQSSKYRTSYRLLASHLCLHTFVEVGVLERSALQILIDLYLVCITILQVL